MRGYSPGPGTAKTSILKIIERFNEEVLRPQGREHSPSTSLARGKRPENSPSPPEGRPSPSTVSETATRLPIALQLRGWREAKKKA